ncbi:MAG: hypothetical protein ACLFPH_07455 [Bacteroidales bacterium]
MYQIVNLQQDWNLISLKSKDHFKASNLLQHHAIQFIAMGSLSYHSMLKSDDGNIMKWDFYKRMIVGKWIDAELYPFKLAIRLDNLELLMVKPPFTITEKINMQGKTKEEIFDWLNEQIDKVGIKEGNLSMDLSYNIPHHKTDDGFPFEIQNKNEMEALASFRNNSEIILHYLSNFFDNCTSVGISPVTFNSSFIVNLTPGGDDNSLKAIDIGFAAPDDLIDHYYFYATPVNSIQNEISYDNIHQLNGDGQWLINDSLVAALPLDRFYRDNKKEKQIYRVLSFYLTAINNFLDILIVPEHKLSGKELFGDKVSLFLDW